MKKTVALYALVIAAAAFLLNWLQYKYMTRVFSTELYIVIVAVGFAVLGAWAGHKLTRKSVAGPFEKNVAALNSLGISDREYQVLELLAAGQANKEVARSLGISPNTVKTHVARLYEKLDVQRRTQAIQKARELELIR